MKLLASVHAKHALLAVVAFSGAIAYESGAAFSLLTGAAIQAVSLGGLDRGVRAMTGAGGGNAAATFLVIGLRFFLVVGLVGLVLTRFPVRPIAFLVGLALILPAVTWHGLSLTKQTT